MVQYWPSTNVTATISGALPAGNNNIGDVDIASALPAGTNAIGKLAANDGVDIGNVDVPLASSAFQDTATVTTAGTRVTLGSHASLTYGFYLTNTHATAIVFVGVAASVSSSAFIFRLAPGQSTPLIPLVNSNILGIDSDTNSATTTFGGF